MGARKAMHVLGLIVLPWFFTCTHVSSKFTYRIPDLKGDYDYIIVGAGSSGSVLANRLSEDPSNNVLLMETGPQSPGITEVPLFVPYLIGSKEDWAYVTEPQENAFLANKNKVVYLSRYGALGGCSSHNFMLYSRGVKRDYNEWSSKHGADGWDWNGVFPYYLKSEDQTDASIQNNGYHGVGGEQTVSALRYVTPSGKALIKAAGTVLGIHPGDYNGEIPTVVSMVQVTQREGRRCSTEKAFLRPAAGRTNLDILTNAHATKINFDEDRAVSVSFDYQNRSNIVRARKEIILSAGAFGSPHLLLVSGIGPADQLRKLGIPLVADLPVGENLHDHVAAYGLHYFVNDSSSIVLPRDVTPQTVGMFEDGEGPLTSPIFSEVFGYKNSKYQNESDFDWPDVQLLSFCGTLIPPPSFLTDAYLAAYQPLLQSEIKTIATIITRPKSRGYLRLRTSNIYDKPAINPRYLSERDDVDRLVEALRMADTWMKAPEMREFNPSKAIKVMPGCESYTDESNEYYECHARQLTASIFHPVGTCKMGSISDNTSVVDPQLRVKGVKGLRVADASIMPVIVSGNTNAPCIMIGEKAAAIILAAASSTP